MSCDYSVTISSHQPACLNPRLNPSTRGFWHIAHTFLFPASSSVQLGNPGLAPPASLIDLHPRSLWLRPCIPSRQSVVLRVIYPPSSKQALCARVRWCTRNWENQFFTRTLKFHEGRSSVKSHATLIILDEMSVANRRSKEVIWTCKGSYQLGFNTFGPSWTFKCDFESFLGWSSFELAPGNAVLLFNYTECSSNWIFLKVFPKGLYIVTAATETIRYSGMLHARGFFWNKRDKER